MQNAARPAVFLTSYAALASTRTVLAWAALGISMTQDTVFQCRGYLRAVNLRRQVNGPAGFPWHTAQNRLVLPFLLSSWASCLPVIVSLRGPTLISSSLVLKPGTSARTVRLSIRLFHFQVHRVEQFGFGLEPVLNSRPNHRHYCRRSRMLFERSSRRFAESDRKTFSVSVCLTSTDVLAGCIAVAACGLICGLLSLVFARLHPDC